MRYTSCKKIIIVLLILWRLIWIVNLQRCREVSIQRLGWFRTSWCLVRCCDSSCGEEMWLGFADLGLAFLSVSEELWLVSSSEPGLGELRLSCSRSELFCSPFLFLFLCFYLFLFLVFLLLEEHSFTSSSTESVFWELRLGCSSLELVSKKEISTKFFEQIRF